MVTMFEPDEGVFLPVVQNMAALKASFTQFAKDFLFYNVYSYGFPYFASSALVILPLQWFGQAESVPSIMLVLRQLISVLPMLLGILLSGLHTGWVPFVSLHCAGCDPVGFTLHSAKRVLVAPGRYRAVPFQPGSLSALER